MFQAGWPATLSSASPEHEKALFDFLATRQVVVDGTITQVIDRAFVATGGCEQVPGQATRREISIRIADVLQGSVASDVIALRVLDAAPFPELKPGVRVIAFGEYQAHDGWKLWGNCIVLLPTGELAMAAGTRVLDEDAKHSYGHGTLQTLLARIRRDAPYSARSLISGASGLALVRITSRAHLPSLRTRFGVTNLGWAYGAGQSVPDSLDFKIPVDCLPEISEGDTLVVPVRHGQIGRTLLVRGFCPETLRVRCGYLPGLGVYLDNIQSAIERGPLGIDVRRRIGVGK